MPTVIFDILQLSKDLREHFSEDQADAIAMALSRGASDRLATKGDMGEVKTTISDLRVALKGDIALLKVDTVRWIVSALAFNFVATASMFIAFFKLSAR